MIRSALHFALRLVCFIGMFATAAAASEDFYRAHLPPGVSMGMSLEELAAARPEARKNEIGAPSSTQTDRREMVEITPQGNTRVAYWYRFKAGKLGAVTRSLMTARMPIEHAQAGASKVADELKADFAMKGQERILRSTGTENTELTAQLWEDRANGLNLYFVTTNREITVVMFDPKAFGKADFFLGPERMKDLNAQAEVVRGMMDKAAATPIPIVDLLPKVTAASATPAPAATPTPSTPVPTSTPIASPAPTTPAAQTPAVAAEREAPVWPWLVGIAVLTVIALLVWKRRA